MCFLSYTNLLRVNKIFKLFKFEEEKIVYVMVHNSYVNFNGNRPLEKVVSVPVLNLLVALDNP